MKKQLAPRLNSPAKPGAKPGRPHAPPGEVRIIGGLYKRTKLAVPDKPGLRPTPDRVRETLFNWLGQDLSGWHCVDPFAGTGALGLEAASRGAASVLMGEQDADLVLRLKALQLKLGAAAVKVERTDGVALLRRLAPASQQLILLDPPFESALFAPALEAAARAVAEPGFIFLEAPEPWGEERLAPLGLAPYRQGKAGMVHFHLWVRRPA